MKRHIGIIAITCSALMASTASQAAPLKAEVLHWWATGGQAAAIKVFADSFDAKGGQWVDNAINSADNAIPAGINRIVGGQPPTALGYYASQIPDLAEQGLLNPLDDIAAKDKWSDILPPYVIDAVSYDGHIYGVPANRVTYNWLWYNKPLFEKLGIAEPKSWDDFFTAADNLKQAGIVPLAYSDQPWQVRLLFYMVLSGVAGKDVYNSILVDRDTDAVKTPEFQKAAETFMKIRGYLDAGITNRMYNDAAQMVMQGQAGMTIGGDWEKGEFTAAKQTAGKDFGCVLGLGSGLFQLDSSIFVMPKDDSNPEAVAAQSLLAKVMLDKDNQLKFNLLKGSLPVRTDVDVSSMDACAQYGTQVISNSDNQVLPPTSAPADMVSSLTDVAGQYWASNGSMTEEQFADKFASVLGQFPK